MRSGEIRVKDVWSVGHSNPDRVTDSNVELCWCDAYSFQEWGTLRHFPDSPVHTFTNTLKPDKANPDKINYKKNQTTALLTTRTNVDEFLSIAVLFSRVNDFLLNTAEQLMLRVYINLNRNKYV